MTMPADGGSAFGDLTFLTRAYQVSKMIQVAASLELADLLADGPQSVAVLAEKSGADPAALLRLCRALAAFDIFAVDPQGEVHQTARSDALRQDATPTLYHAARYWTSPHIWAAWSDLEHAVRTGDSAFEAVHQVPKFEYLRLHPDEAELFDLFMQHSPDDRHAAAAAVADLSDAALVVDVGGGNGALLTALLQRHPTLSGLLFDQEEVVAGASDTLAAVAGRVRVVGGSFFDRVPAGGDVYLLSQVLHDWDDQACRQILAAVRAAMEPGGRLMVIERLLEPGSGPLHYLSDMNMMVNLHGRERSLDEFTQLLSETGFGAPTVVRTQASFSILGALSL